MPTRCNVLKIKGCSCRALLDDLSFIKDKKKWGFPFRKGSFKISFEDFELIAKKMGIILDE